MATNRDDIAEIQACITNTLDRNAIGNNRIVGIIGDAPSHYAKSPTIWNPVFQRLKDKLRVAEMNLQITEWERASLQDENDGLQTENTNLKLWGAKWRYDAHRSFIKVMFRADKAPTPDVPMPRLE